jgi:hypothetical protein
MAKKKHGIIVETATEARQADVHAGPFDNLDRDRGRDPWRRLVCSLSRLAFLNGQRSLEKPPGAPRAAPT